MYSENAPIFYRTALPNELNIFQTFIGNGKIVWAVRSIWFSRKLTFHSKNEFQIKIHCQSMKSASNTSISISFQNIKHQKSNARAFSYKHVVHVMFLLKSFEAWDAYVFTLLYSGRYFRSILQNGLFPTTPQSTFCHSLKVFFYILWFN